MKNLFSVKTIVATGIGAAVFVVLGMFAVVPTGIPNTEIQTAYAFLALLSAIYGPIAGALAGFIGHTLKDVFAYGSPWWSWIFPSGVVGLVIGVYGLRSGIREGVFGVKDMITFNVFQIIANALAWFLLAPGLDVLIYEEPFNLVVTQGLVAGVANIVTIGVIGTALIYIYAKAIPKKGSLTKE